MPSSETIDFVAKLIFLQMGNTDPDQFAQLPKRKRDIIVQVAKQIIRQCKGNLLLR